MARQRELFPEPETILGLHKKRRDPNLWVRRVLIWSEPTKLIREVELRRGLNIVWSPDAGADMAQLGSPEASGHGAGKSLFCRLIRYCLGEHGFATSELTERIGEVLVEGWVGAEVVVGGQTWGIVRPLGHAKKSRVGKCPPEQLLSPGRNRPGASVLAEAIADHVLESGLEQHIPGNKEGRAWLTALAWLSRDQDCRFGHILEWRATGTESDSPVLGMSKEAHLIAVRLLLGIVSVRELGARRELDDVYDEQQRVDAERELSAAKLTDLTARLATAFPSGDPSLGPLWVSALDEQATKRLEAAEHELDEAVHGTERVAREEERHQVLRDLSELWAKLSISTKIAALLEREHASHVEELSGVAERSRNEQRGKRLAWHEAKKLREAVSELRERLGAKEELERRFERLRAEKQRLEEEIELHRKAHDKEVARLDGLFKYVVKGLLGTDREATLILTADRLRADVALGGTAMESLKSVAFDLAALLHTLERTNSLPAFLIHDSPREADLGASHYQNIFRLLAKLEGLGKAPPFQYIITTTTDPPAELATDEYVRLRLSGSSPKDRLLKVAL